MAADSTETKDTVGKVRDKFNQWLQGQFQGKVFLALDNYSFPVKRDQILTQDFAAIWSQANKNLDGQRSQKFRHQLKKLLAPQPAHEHCKVCHRDDVEPDKLKPVNQNDQKSPSACPVCCQMFELGEDLFRVDAVVRSPKETEKRKGSFGNLQMSDATYHLFRNYENINIKDNEILFLVNDWNLKHYHRKKNSTTPLFLGNYSKTVTDQVEENNQTTLITRSITASELAKASQGIKRVSYIRMDVDNLGQIFARGLKASKQQTLPQIASLSRQMTYFFKVYLNSLAEDRDNNLPQDENYTKIDLPKKGEKRDNLLFIYAGGDDLFISGAWNEVVEFGFDVDQSFRAYTGYNPDITISAGIDIAIPKFPLYQAAAESGDAEDAAKGNGRDSLTLFSETFKWDEWLGSKQISIETVESKDKKYWQQVATKPKAPELLGVFPIVERLNSKQLGRDYARNFVRNLVNVSNLQRQKLKEIADKRRETNYQHEDKDIKYYLHLPQIAYTLDRLPKNVLDDDDFRKALKNPYNAPYYRAIAIEQELTDNNTKTATKDGKTYARIKGRNNPARLIVRDCHLQPESADKLKKIDTGLYMTEWKFENSIDRITAAANPRQFERVPGGSMFKFEMVYTVEDKEQAVEDLKNLAIALAVLEDDALGGHGSRGYGKISFTNLQLFYRDLSSLQTIGQPTNELGNFADTESLLSGFETLTGEIQAQLLEGSDQ